MQGQASRIEDWGSPRLNVGGLGDGKQVHALSFNMLSVFL